MVLTIFYVSIERLLERGRKENIVWGWKWDADESGWKQVKMITLNHSELAFTPTPVPERRGWKWETLVYREGRVKARCAFSPFSFSPSDDILLPPSLQCLVCLVSSIKSVDVDCAFIHHFQQVIICVAASRQNVHFCLIFSYCRLHLASVMSIHAESKPARSRG